MNQEKIGNLIKDIRLKNNLTQKEFAKVYGVTYQAVSKWENGQNIPDISLLKQICDDYNIDINYLLKGTKKRKKNRIFLIVTLVIIVILILLFLLNYKNNKIELKPIESNCDSFNVTGVIAYNKNKSSIYINDINYCSDDDLVYTNITCTLYENNKKIYSYSKKNISLNKFLNNIDFHVDNYKNSCSYIKDREFYLVIETKSKNNTVSYKVPLKLKNNC